jgi:hypothetical protein
MTKTITQLPPALRQMAEKHFVLLESKNRAKKRDAVALNLSGYTDVMFLIADIVKVSLLALEFETSSTRIPEPNANISGVLSIILDLLPYEEAELLDRIREAILQPAEAPPMEEYFLENIFLTVPTELQ